MVQILKVHGSQNKFFLLDQALLKKPLTKKELVSLAQQLTNPQTGPLGGADGLLVVSESTHPQALGKMQVVNADGSFASMCGNGLRTVGRYLAQKYQKNLFKVETEQADLRVTCQPDWAPEVKAVGVEISPVSFQRQDLPFAGLNTEQLFNQPVPAFAPDLKFTAVAVPNPHLISIVSPEILNSNLLEKLGTQLNQSNPYFPNGVNVSFAQIISPKHLFVRTFERGVGFTNACGTGMSAASLVFALTHSEEKIFEQRLKVSNPGGFVQTIVHQEKNRYWIELIGNATITHYFEISENELHQKCLNFEHLNYKVTTEDESYQSYLTNQTE